MLNPGNPYPAFIKPRFVLPQIFTAIAGMLLSVPRLPSWRALVFGTVGIWMALSSAAALNRLIGRHVEYSGAGAAQRAPTACAPSDHPALASALLMATASMLVLALLANPLTAGLALGGIIGCSAVHAAFVQRATPQHIVIGGFADALVPLLGWAAVTNMPSARDWAYALLLVLIVFTWTPPHLWSLALIRRDDFRRAAVPAPAMTHGVERTRTYVLFYTILLVLASLFPYLAGMAGPLYLGGAATLGVGHLYCALRLLIRPRGERFAMRVFGYSTLYLYALFAFLLADHWLGGPATGAGDYMYRLIG